MSASTMTARVRLGERELAQLRRAEAEMRAERERRAAAELAARCEDFAQMDVEDSAAFGHLAARCEALSEDLPAAEIAAEHARILADARSGNRGLATERIEGLERRINLDHRTQVSQDLVTGEILRRAGVEFVDAVREGGTLKGNLEFGGDQAIPLTITPVPSADEGPVEHEVVFQNARHRNMPDCPEREDAVRKVVRAAEPEMQLAKQRDRKRELPARGRKKAASAGQAKTRRAG